MAQVIRLGDLLVQKGYLSEQELKELLVEQKSSGRKLGLLIIERGIIKEEVIATLLAEQLHLEFINLATKPVDAENSKLLSEPFARRFKAVVLEGGSFFKVAIADPTDLTAQDEIKRQVKTNIQWYVATDTQITETIDRIYRKTEHLRGFAEELKQDISEVEVNTTFNTVLNAQSAEDAPVLKLIYTMFEDAIQARASDVHIEPMEDKTLIRFRIDGELHLQTEADIRIHNAIVSRLKLLASLDISEKRLPQDGRFQMNTKSREVDIRISTVPVQYGESVVMRLLVQDSSLYDLTHLGMPDAILQSVRKAIHKSHGMVLVTGPTGSGKTTTLYSALTELNKPNKKILTAEDPVEYRLYGINQIQVQEKINLDFGTILRALMRQDPDVIMVGEIRDRETAEIAIRASITGHTVLSTLHTNDAATTALRLIDMGVPPYLIATSLRLVVAQRLLRINCKSCVDYYEPKPEEKAWIEHTTGVVNAQFKRGRGCAHCNHTGYHGRVGVYETFEMNEDLVSKLHMNDLDGFRIAAQNQMSGHNMAYAAAQHAISGLTSIEEALKLSMSIVD